MLVALDQFHEKISEQVVTIPFFASVTLYSSISRSTIPGLSVHLEAAVVRPSLSVASHALLIDSFSGRERARA